MTLASLVIAATALIALAHSQGCEYDSYLKCVKQKLDADYCGIETEFNGDYKSLVLSCFSATDASRCKLAEGDLANAFTAEGPLKGCPICLTAARIIKSLFLTAPDKTLSCIRGEIGTAVGKEIELCVKQGVPNFKISYPLPDFDEGSSKCRELTLTTAGSYIVADRSLYRCSRTKDRGGQRQKRSQVQANATQSCLTKRQVGGKTIWAKECGIMKDCRKDFGPNCPKSGHFNDVEKAGCQCIEDKRAEVQTKIDKAAVDFDDIVKKESVTADDKSQVANCNACQDSSGQRRDKCDAGSLIEWKTCRCVAVATSLLDSTQPGHPSLRDTLKKIIACVDDKDKDSKLGGDVDGIVKTLCFRVASYKADPSEQSGDTLQPRDQLRVAINFLKSLFDALVLRVQRFCPGAHCSV